MSRKPSPGVCGVCGRAVVRPTPEQYQRYMDGAARRWSTWVEGHHYDLDGRLIEVRCFQHEPDDGELWG